MMRRRIKIGTSRRGWQNNKKNLQCHHKKIVPRSFLSSLLLLSTTPTMLYLPTTQAAFGIHHSVPAMVRRHQSQYVQHQRRRGHPRWKTRTMELRRISSSNQEGEGETRPGISVSRITTANTPLPSNRLGKKQGVYVRPSAAIERGSGFFVPGLEGSKIRLVAGVVLLLVTLILGLVDGVGGSGRLGDDLAMPFLSQPQPGNLLALVIATVYSLFVLLQAAVEYQKEQQQSVASLVSSATPRWIDDENSITNARLFVWQDQPYVQSNLTQQTSTTRTNIPIGDTVKFNHERVEWVASSFMALTPTRAMYLIQRDGIIFAVIDETFRSQQMLRSGSVSPSVAVPAEDRSSNKDAVRNTLLHLDSSSVCQAVIETVMKSTTGRVALPPSHIAFTLFNSSNDNNKSGEAEVATIRTLLLQRINAGSKSNASTEGTPLCWIVASDQLLPSFTNQDLKWLGRLALYTVTDNNKP